MKVLYFEDVEIGTKLTCGTYDITKEEVVSFAGQWDPQPYHINEEAAQASIYGGLTASGIHIMAIRTWLLHRIQPKPAILASLGWDELRFPNPARIGDRLHLEVEFVYRRRWPRKTDRGIVKSIIKVINQNNATILVHKDSVLVAKRDSKEKISGTGNFSG